MNRYHESDTVTPMMHTRLGKALAITLLSAPTCSSLAAQASSVWTQVATTGPAPRGGHAMAYDAQRNCIILFGGRASGTNFGDTWERHGTTWIQVANAGPLARSGHSMAHDAQRGRTVMFGGAGAPGPQYDTWEWDGAAWAQVSTMGGGSAQDSAMAYNSQRGRVTLFSSTVSWLPGAIIAATQDRATQDRPKSSAPILDRDAADKILAAFGLGRESAR